MIQDKIRQEIESYKTLKWFETSSGKLILALSAIFLITAWYRFILAILLLPIIFFVKRGSKMAMILGGIYSVILTLVNISVYISNNRGSDGNFHSSMVPIYIFLVLLVLVFVFIRKAYVVRKNMNKDETKTKPV